MILEYERCQEGDYTPLGFFRGSLLPGALATWDCPVPSWQRDGKCKGCPCRHRGATGTVKDVCAITGGTMGSVKDVRAVTGGTMGSVKDVRAATGGATASVKFS